MKKYFTTTTKVFTLSLLILSLGLLGCKKGDTGPIGPIGPTGQAGTNGSSNVTIKHFSISPGSWSTQGSSLMYYNSSVSVPTTDVCMVYFSTDNSSFLPLPFSSYFNNGDNLGFNYETGYGIQVLYYDPNGVSGNITQTLYFNVADIPLAQIKADPNVNLKSYTAVKKAFNLE